MRALLLIVLLIVSFPAVAQTIEEDKTAARIMVYYGVGHEASPATSVTIAQFKAHLRELDKGNYNVVALPDLIKAYDKNVPLPKNTVVITFDGSEKSVLTRAAPLLKRYNFPFTVFLSPERIRDNNPRYLNIKDIKLLQKTPLISFGVHPKNYIDETLQDIETIRSNINNAVAFYRDIFKTQPKYFAFPHGIYSADKLKTVKNYGFKALFGEQSGVVYQNKKGTVLPRFVMTENYANQHRFKMTANALPLPAKDITPNASIVSTNTPIIGFTTTSKISLNKLSCYASGQAKPSIETLGNRVEIRLKRPIDEPRFRVNCTIPVVNENEDAPKRWRWFGLLLDNSNHNENE